MARQRSIKPEFFRDRHMAALGSRVALIYQALWLIADDGGVAVADPDLLKGEMFARWSEMTPGTLTEGLQALSDRRRIRLYSIGDDLFAEIPTLLKHQTVNHPSKFRHPRGGQAVTDLRAFLGGQLSFGHSGRTPVALPAPSLSETISNTETISKSREEAEETAAAASSFRSRLPEVTRTAYDAVRRSARNATAFDAELGALLDGMRAPLCPTPDQLGRALQDMHLNGDAPSGAKLRRYVEVAIREMTAPPRAAPAATVPGNPFERMLDGMGGGGRANA